jgi:hypothetical protein
MSALQQFARVWKQENATTARCCTRFPPTRKTTARFPT